MNTSVLKPSVEELFDKVRSESTPGLFASEGPLYYGAVFGRDSLEASEHLLDFEPYIPRTNTLHVLASLQGLTDNPITEEEPGRIHHEYRHIRNVRDEEGMRIFRDLSDKWGGGEEEFTYYGSIDATPLFVRLSVSYIRRYGPELLDDPIRGRDGVIRPFSEHLLMAKEWLERRLEDSDIGMIEFKRTNPHGILNQVWKDSDTGLIHSDGQPLNYEFPIAPIEAQGYAYDALKGMSKLFPGLVDSSEISEYGQRIIEYFWLPDEDFFAQALDRNSSGLVRQVGTPSSNAGLLLDSDVLLDQPGQGTKVEAVVNRLMGSEFLTPAGIRCRSLKFSHLVEFPDYHGSFAEWSKDTTNIVRGMIRHSFDNQARDLARRVVDNIARHDREFYEFNFVDRSGQVIHPLYQKGKFADSRCNVPEPGQTWTKSAFIYCLRLIQQ